MKEKINKVLEKLKTRQGPTLKEITEVMDTVDRTKGIELLHAYEEFLRAEGWPDPRQHVYKSFGELARGTGVGSISLKQYQEVWRPILVEYGQEHNL